jgi:hypothetical protein
MIMFILRPVHGVCRKTKYIFVSVLKVLEACRKFIWTGFFFRFDCLSAEKKKKKEIETKYKTEKRSERNKLKRKEKEKMATLRNACVFFCYIDNESRKLF